MYTDIIYTNGAIYTLDEQQPWAECVVIRDGKFVYVGDDLGGKAYIGAQSIVIDLKGKMAMPGLHDMHIHGVEGPLLSCFNVNSR